MASFSIDIFADTRRKNLGKETTKRYVTYHYFSILANMDQITKILTNKVFSVAAGTELCSLLGIIDLSYTQLH